MWMNFIEISERCINNHFRLEISLKGLKNSSQKDIKRIHTNANIHM